MGLTYNNVGSFLSGPLPNERFSYGFLYFHLYLYQSSQTEVPPEYLVALSVHLQNILRNKRCLLAYMQV